MESSASAASTPSETAQSTASSGGFSMQEQVSASTVETPSPQPPSPSPSPITPEPVTPTAPFSSALTPPVLGFSSNATTTSTLSPPSASSIFAAASSTTSPHVSSIATSSPKITVSSILAPILADIVTPSTTASLIPLGGPADSSGTPMLSTPVIAGIAAGGAVLLIAAIVGAVLISRRRRGKSDAALRAPSPAPAAAPKYEMQQRPETHTPAAPATPSPMPPLEPSRNGGTGTELKPFYYSKPTFPTLASQHVPGHEVAAARTLQEMYASGSYGQAAAMSTLPHLISQGHGSAADPLDSNSTEPIEAEPLLGTDLTRSITGRKNTMAQFVDFEGHLEPLEEEDHMEPVEEEDSHYVR
ncbi:hypothetical protein HDU96_008548 [Phlyctochytrium bullatum]|nr:hypothetical protein HDU96_008548 [Phlyctochytrium bullatum]